MREGRGRAKARTEALARGLARGRVENVASHVASAVRHTRSVCMCVSVCVAYSNPPRRRNRYFRVVETALVLETAVLETHGFLNTPS